MFFFSDEKANVMFDLTTLEVSKDFKDFPVASFQHFLVKQMET